MMGKPAWIGLFAAMMMVGAALAVPAREAALAQVRAALDRGEAQEAADLANKSLTDGAAKDGRLLFYRGLAEELLGAHDPAIEDFTAALASSDLSVEERTQTLLQRGFLCDGLGRLDMAVADYTAIIALKGQSLGAALNNRANIYRRQNRFQEARRDYQAALSAGSGKTQYSWYGLGQIAEAEADTLTARAYYAKAVAIDPSYGLAAERLLALGGPPDGSVQEPNQTAPSSSPPPGSEMKVAVQESAASDAIVLHPPRAAASTQGEPIVLHLPKRPKPAFQPAPPAVAEPVMQQTSLMLRPALDQPRHEARLAGEEAAEVQLGAWRSEREARAGWDEARSRADGALDGLGPHILVADLPGKGRYYRLRVAPKETRASFCATLVEKGLDCLPVRE